MWNTSSIVKEDANTPKQPAVWGNFFGEKSFVQQRFGINQISRVKPLGEPFVDLHKQLTRYFAFTLSLP
jgi:hypothetical protein